ncbi:MAG: penicillin-binding protein 2, partial [Phormidesmis sp. CAN_BIN44]|nr:penicillin-binding protein 2 [Phormidesmis sp. CAN_BIN44]
MASGFSFVSTTSRINQTRSRRSHRSVLLFMVATTLISGCMFRLAQLQIVQGQRNRQLADQNRIRPLSIVADRGNILDRRGVPLAANQLSRSIYLYPREQSMQQWQDSAEKLSKILDVSAEEILKKLNQVGYRSAVPARIYRNLTPHQFVALAEGGQIPGLEIQAESSRHYPNGNLAAHILGYIGEATADDLKANPDFPMGMLLGQMGIERIADPSLRGKWGSHLIEVDSVGKELRMLGEQKPTSGADLRLTLDLKLQQAAEKALNNQRGAVVALDVKTGAVLVMASGPTFDPNLFTRKISTQEWKDLQGKEQPFLNRSLQGYPPGSTFKIVTTSAGIQSGKFSTGSTLPTFGAINIGGTLFHEYGGAGYGTIGFRDALAFSSNTFFYQVGMAVGPDEISKWGHRLGIGETSSMGLEGGSHGVIPTPEQKQKLYGEPWYGGDTVSMSIGQGVV